jgi:transcriptional regulator with XRE-family HTH domain
MATQKLENYLRAYRKRSGLSQREVAFLLGCRNGAPVSRYEQRRRLPPLQTALACEAVFGVPVSELFGGVRASVDRKVGRRLSELKSRLQAKGREDHEPRATAEKLRWIARRVSSSTVSHHSA